MRFLIPCSVFCLLCSFASAQWEPDVRLTNDPASTFTAAPNNHPVCANGDSVYAVLTDNRTGTYQVYFTRSFDAGTNWDSVVCLSADSADIFTPALAVSGATVHVAWPTRSALALKYRRSTDAGATWSEEDTLVATPAGLGDPCLAADGNTVGIVWGDERDGNYNGELYLKRSSDGGESWGSDTRLTVRPDTIDKEPCLAIDGSSWHLAWTQSDWANFHTRAWYQRSTDGGGSWLTPGPLTLDTMSQSQPQVAIVGSNVHVCWWDGRPGGYGTWYRRSTDNGSTWNTERYLADTTYGSDYPSIAASGGNVYLVYRAWPAAQFVIDYRGSSDNGQTWSAETALTTAAGMGTAALAAAGGCAHLILYDNRDGNHEIYYKRNQTAGGVEEAMNDQRRTTNVGPDIVRGVFFLPPSPRPCVSASPCLLDVCGRKVLDLRPGSNEIGRLAPGVYFVSAAGSSSRARLVLVR
jgi:hypothetical protein